MKLTQLIELEPGTGTDPNGAGIHSFALGKWTTSHGQRGTSVDSYLDGVDTTDPHFGGASITSVNLDKSRHTIFFFLKRVSCFIGRRYYPSSNSARCRILKISGDEMCGSNDFTRQRFDCFAGYFGS